MPTLSNINGASLVPDFSQGLNALFQGITEGRQREAQQAKQQAISGLFDKLLSGGQPINPNAPNANGAQTSQLNPVFNLSDPNPNSQTRTLLRIGQIGGPKVMKDVADIIERGDKRELEATRQRGLADGRLSLALKRQPDRASQDRFLTQRAEQQIANGQDPSDTIAMLNMNDYQLNNKILSGEVGAADVVKLTTDALTPTEPAKPGALQQKIATLEGELGRKLTQPEILQIGGATKRAPLVQVTPGQNPTFKIPPGFMLKDQNDPSKGVTPIPGGPGDDSVTGDAAKIQMLRTATKAFDGVKSLVFKKDGELDKANLVNAELNTPGTKGRELRTRMEFGIQAITRLETGAAMPPEEVENTRTRFMPTALDSDVVANLKLDMFDDFMGGTLKLIDPAGRFDSERFESELAARAGDESSESNIVLRFDAQGNPIQ